MDICTLPIGKSQTEIVYVWDVAEEGLNKIINKDKNNERNFMIFEKK